MSGGREKRSREVEARRAKKACNLAIAESCVSPPRWIPLSLCVRYPRGARPERGALDEGRETRRKKGKRASGEKKGSNQKKKKAKPFQFSILPPGSFHSPRPRSPLLRASCACWPVHAGILLQQPPSPPGREAEQIASPSKVEDNTLKKRESLARCGRNELDFLFFFTKG